MIDTHAHLNFDAFASDFEAVIERAKRAGMTAIINVGSNLETSKRAVEMARKHDCCFAAVGIHPIHAEDIRILGYWDIKSKLKKLAEKPKVVAVGETGLDYYRNQVQSSKPSTRAQAESFKVQSYSLKLKVEEIRRMQKELFKLHLELAEELNLPLIIHNREAHDDVLEILSQVKGQWSNVKGVFHCFSGSKNFLKKVLEMGFYVGFDGNVTYKTANDLRELVKATPLSRLLLETDCPYLTPDPLRSRPRTTLTSSQGLRPCLGRASVRGKNEPKNVKIIGEFAAKLKNIDFNRLKNQTTENAKVLFKI